MSKNIQLGDEKGLKFPSVWDWSLQFTARDRTLFRNPSYVGKSAPRLPTGSAKASRRAKVSGRRADGSGCPRSPWPATPAGAERSRGTSQPALLCGSPGVSAFWGKRLHLPFSAVSGAHEALGSICVSLSLL